MNNPDLKRVNLRGCYRMDSTDGKPNLTDAGIFAVAKHCRHLVLLDVAWQESLTDAALEEVARYCPQLKSIDLSGCRQISDQGVFALIAECKNLQSIILFRCDRISEKTKEQIQAAGCRVLEY